MDLSVTQVINYLGYWIIGWKVINILLPPREIFEQGTPQWYNTMLKLVAYWGELNLRGIAVRMYSVTSKPADQLQQSLERASTAAREQLTASKETMAAVEQAKSIDAHEASAKP